MKNLFRLWAFIVMLCSSVAVMAQSSADKLFLEGQKLQQVQTVASQNQAIKKFQAAKVVYTTADKKQMCDNQISICKKNIQSLSAKPKTSGSKTSKKSGAEEEKPAAENPAPVAKKRTDVQLSLSESRLDFKYKPKAGATQSVKVTCNYDDWTIASKPDWVSTYISDDHKKFSVEAEENKEEENRSGIIVVKCEDTEVNLIVNQNMAKATDKIVGGLKDLIKKKK